MSFDGSAYYDGTGASVVFVSPQRQVLPYSFVFSKQCSKNVIEYQALITRLQMAIEMKITNFEIYGDSKLTINQLLTLYEDGNIGNYEYIDTLIYIYIYIYIFICS